MEKEHGGTFWGDGYILIEAWVTWVLCICQISLNICAFYFMSTFILAEFFFN